MKFKILVAFVATTTLIFLSCNWFRSKKKDLSNPLVGEWRLNSIKARDSIRFANFLVTCEMLDTNTIDVSITKDTIITHAHNETDTVGYSFDEKKNELIMKDSINPVLSFAKFSDSLITLTTKDSTILFLQKK